MKAFKKNVSQAPLYERGWGCVFEVKGRKVKGRKVLDDG